ncbi:hypothetical protein EMIT036CA2_10217 [Chryseobacterium sp. IT-36CA2]
MSLVEKLRNSKAQNFNSLLIRRGLIFRIAAQTFGYTS